MHMLLRRLKGALFLPVFAVLLCQGCAKRGLLDFDENNQIVTRKTCFAAQEAPEFKYFNSECGYDI